MSTETAIAAAALKLWAQKGYQGVGIQEICLASGVTKPTLYHWFGSKQGLLSRLLEEGFAPLCRDLEDRGAYRGDVKMALLGWMGVWMDQVRRAPEFMRLQLSLGTAPPDSEEYITGAPWQEKVYATLSGLFAGAARDHGNMAGRENTYTLSFLGTLQAQGAACLNGRQTWSEPQAREVLHHFMHGIFS